MWLGGQSKQIEIGVTIEDPTSYITQIYVINVQISAQ